MALSGDAGGVAEALEWIVDSAHPGYERLSDALSSWRASLSLTERTRLRLTGRAPRPVRLTFPPGEL
jgi:hypothetical protein